MITPIARAAWGCTALIGGALSLSACAPDGGVGGEVSQGAISEGEARALDEAAEMLEQRRLPDGVLPEGVLPDAGAADRVLAEPVRSGSDAQAPRTDSAASD